MALFIRQNEDRSKLQERLAAELREKAKTQAANNNDRPDGIVDSDYLRDTKTTTSLAWVWIVIALIVIGLFIFYIAGSTK